MSMTDPLGDMLTRIRNGQRAGLTSVTSPASKMRERVLTVLQDEGFIRGFSVTELRSGISEITIELKYQEGTPVIREIQRVSRPGRRVYSKIRDLRQVYGGLASRSCRRRRASCPTTPRARKCRRRGSVPRLLGAARFEETLICHV